MLGSALKQGTWLKMTDGTSKTAAKPHPIQPLEKVDGVLRFKSNAIVELLTSMCDMDKLALEHDFSLDDWTQLAQLVGYSVSGAAGMNFVDKDTIRAAVEMHKRGATEADARIFSLKESLKEARSVAKRARELLEEIGDD